MIVAGIEGQDNSFFKIESTDIEDKVLNEDIISFSYEEEMGRYNTGTLTINDPTNTYSKLLRVGAKLYISFGYNLPDSSSRAVLLKKLNPGQIFGANARTGIIGYIKNPSGKGGSDGTMTFTCNFYGREMLAEKAHRVHTGITKSDFVYQLLTEIGCDVMEVNFSRGKEFLNENTQIFQRETNYILLLRFAREWRALFRLSYNSKGQLTAIFISPEYLDSSAIPALMSGAIGGDSMFLEWKQGVANVIEYTWKNHQGDSGYGDNVRIVYGANGQPTFMRFVAQKDTVLVYKLNPEKIKRRLKQAKTQAERNALMKEWLQAKDFEQVKEYFDPVQQSTAPQGLGYSMTAKVFGSPLCSPPLKCFFGEGFPVWFTPKNKKKHIVNYYCNKVTHTISRDGYKMDLSIADAYTISGGAMVG